MHMHPGAGDALTTINTELQSAVLPTGAGTTHRRLQRHRRLPCLAQCAAARQRAGGCLEGSCSTMLCDPIHHEHAHRVVGRDLIELECPVALVGVRVRVRYRDLALVREYSGGGLGGRARR